MITGRLATPRAKSRPATAGTRIGPSDNSSVTIGE